MKIIKNTTFMAIGALLLSAGLNLQSAMECPAQEKRIELSPEGQVAINKQFFLVVDKALQDYPAGLTPAQKDTLENLLAQGANINARNKNGYTPLGACYAPASRQNTTLIEFLLSHNADASIPPSARSNNSLLYEIYSHGNNIWTEPTERFNDTIVRLLVRQKQI